MHINTHIHTHTPLSDVYGAPPGVFACSPHTLHQPESARVCALLEEYKRDAMEAMNACSGATVARMPDRLEDAEALST
jgi:hypothetical protein